MLKEQLQILKMKYPDLLLNPLHLQQVVEVGVEASPSVAGPSEAGPSEAGPSEAGPRAKKIRKNAFVSPGVLEADVIN